MKIQVFIKKSKARNFKNVFEIPLDKGKNSYIKGFFGESYFFRDLNGGSNCKTIMCAR